MQNHGWLLMSVFFLTGCMGVPEEPKGMPRSALLHKHLPSILTLDNQQMKLCDAGVAKVKRNGYCQLVLKALAGSSATALRLAEAHSGKTTSEEKLYWYGVAADNGDVTGMYKLGSIFYDTPFAPDPIGSKARGRFWLKKAAQNGSKTAEQKLESIKQQTYLDEYKIENKASENNLASDDLLKCGEPYTNSVWNWSVPTMNEGFRLKCEDLPALERQALSGDAEAAARLWSFFIFIKASNSQSDYMYWEAIATQNGGIGFTRLRGSTLKHIGGETNETRGDYWLHKG